MLYLLIIGDIFVIILLIGEFIFWFRFDSFVYIEVIDGG